MQQSDAGLRGNFIAEAELLTITKTWFEARFPDFKDHEAEAAAKRMVVGLWERNYLLCPRGPKLYGFLHRTFMEYLTAMEYVRQFQQLPSFTLKELVGVFEENKNKPEWREVLSLVSGSIGDDWTLRCLDALLSTKIKPGWVRRDSPPYWLVLIPECLAEIQSTSKIIEYREKFVEKCAEALLDDGGWREKSLAFVTDLVGACRQLGHIAPTPDLSFERPKFINDYLDIGTVCWPELISGLTRNHTQILELVDDPFDAIRFSAIRAVALDWPTESTRQLLIERTTNDNHGNVRRRALQSLVAREEWADDTTRQLVTQCATKDDHEDVRSEALQLLAEREDWADATTRQLLTHCATEDDHKDVRNEALQLLAEREEWADDTTRQLLTQGATEDDHKDVRNEALQLLAERDEWADDSTRQLVTQRATEDDHRDVRSRALQLLAERREWADDISRQLVDPGRHR